MDTVVYKSFERSNYYRAPVRVMGERRTDIPSAMTFDQSSVLDFIDMLYSQFNFRDFKIDMACYRDLSFEDVSRSNLPENRIVFVRDEMKEEISIKDFKSALLAS